MRNECFKCDEKYFEGHKCRNQFHRIELIMDDDQEVDSESEEGDDDAPIISLHALTRVVGRRTTRVKG